MLIINIKNSITGAVSAADNNDGTYRVDMFDGTSRLATNAEILSSAKISRINYLKSSCSTAINLGFTSNSLGAAHTYDSALPQDQINLLGAKLSGVSLNYSCADSTGAKAQVLHTAAQIAQVFTDGASWIEVNKAQFWSRAAAVQAATTIADVQAVVW